MKLLLSRSGRGLFFAACWLTLSIAVRGQAVTVLHSFGDGNVTPDGATPIGGLIQGADGNLYGTTNVGGSFNLGTIFRMTPQGAVTILYNFGGVTNDGANPQGALLQASDGNFYGTTKTGGTMSQGTIFRMTQHGIVTILHNFGDGSAINPDGTAATTDGTGPTSALVETPDGNFLGTTTPVISMYTSGTFFRMTPQGTVTIITSQFGGSGLIQASDGNYYGTSVLPENNTDGPYRFEGGSIFQFTSQGSYSQLHVFPEYLPSFPGQYVGTLPIAGLLQGSDGNFYGTTSNNVYTQLLNVLEYGYGMLFKMTPQGTLTYFHTFGDGTLADDGAAPTGALVEGSDGNYYGTTDSGGINYGTIFGLTTQGAYTILHRFGDGTAANDGQNPQAGMTLGSDGNLYGVTTAGGSAGMGTVFRFAPTAPLLTSGSSASGSVSLPFSYQVTGTLKPTGFAATNLPDGLTINPSTGLISGKPTTVETNIVSVMLFNGTISNTVPVTITIGPLQTPVFTSFLSTYGTVGTSFSYTPTADNAITGTTFSADTPLPNQLVIDPSTGAITGIPAAGTAGIYPITLSATNPAGMSSVTLNLQLFATNPSLGQEYGYVTSFDSNSRPLPYSIYQAFDGSLFGINGDGLFKMTLQGAVSTLVSGCPYVIQGSDGNFYGTGSNGTSIFKITPSGQSSDLHDFARDTYISQYGGLETVFIQASDGNLYGSTTFDGIPFYLTPLGSFFKLTTQGVFTNLGYITDGGQNNGIYPNIKMVQASDGNLYGVMTYGGHGYMSTLPTGDGVIFELSLTSSLGGTLHVFGDGSVQNDGINPTAPLIQAVDGSLYGTTSGGGDHNSGTIFKITLPTAQTPAVYTILYSFGATATDGTGPNAALIQALDGNFYGTTGGGGANGSGTLFELAPPASGSTTYTCSTVYNFGNGTADLTNPGPIVQTTGGNFYGLTYGGGQNALGGAFTIQGNLTPAIPPTIIGATTGTATATTPFFFGVQALNYKASSGGANGMLVKAVAKPAVITPSLVSQVLSYLLPKSTGAAPQDDTSLDMWDIETIQDQTATLPNYLSFDGFNGVLFGTLVLNGANAASPGIYNYHVNSTTSAGTSTATLTLYFETSPDLSSSKITDSASAGSAYTYYVTVAAYDFPINYGATNLPSWLAIDTAGGSITGTPPGPGYYAFNPLVNNQAGTSGLQVSLQVNSATPATDPTITPATDTATGTAGGYFTYQIVAANTPSSYTAQNLPPSLLINPTTGLISGRPTTAGTFLVPISATNGSATYASYLTLTINPAPAPVLNRTLYATGIVNVPLNYQIPVTGYASNFTMTGTLPTGLILNTATGVISGTPQAATNSSSVTISATNTTGTGNDATLDLNIVAAAVSYSDWQSRYGLTNGGPDTEFGDNVPNQLKYLCDIAPNATMTATERAGLPVVGTMTSLGAQYLTITYTQYAACHGTTVVAETSSDLVH